MSPLPFLVVHGAVIAKLAVAAVTAGCFGLLVLVRRRRQRRDDRETAKLRGALAGRLAPGAATLRGTLHGDAMMLTEIPGATMDPKHARSVELYIDVAGERVDLLGDVYVTSGTRGAAGRRFPRGTPDELRRGTRPGTRRLLAVGEGDDVAVTGTLWSTSDGRWQLAGPIDLVAMQPAGIPRPLPATALIASLAVFALVGYGGLRWLGSTLVARHHDKPDTAELGLALELAAALPHSRTEALHDAFWQLHYVPRSEEVLQRRLAIADLIGGCAERARFLVEEDRYAEVLATARGCAPAADATALARLGNYADAAAVLAAHREVVTDAPAAAAIIAIGAGRWRDAGDATDLVREKVERERTPADAPILATIHAENHEAAACLGDWFRSKAGDTAAALRLAAHASDSHISACAIPRALALPAADRTAELERIATAPYGTYNNDGSDLARALLWLDGAPSRIGADLQLAPLRNGLGRDPWAWLGANAAEPTAPEERDAFRFYRSQRALTRGDARGALADAAAIGDEHGAEIVALTALHTDTRPLAWKPPPYHDRELAHDVELRNGTFTSRERYAESQRDLDRALRTALGGDGAALAHELLAHGTFERRSVMAVLPYVTTHRDELVAALRLFDPGFVGSSPFDIVDDAATRRDLLRVAGDPDGAARWQAIVTGQLTMLADRDKVIALLLWHE